MRNDKIEFLRCLSMAMVLVLHYLLLGGVLGKLTPADGVNYYLAWLLEALCYVAVNVFVLISGYFLSTVHDIKVGKALIMVLQCFVYSVGIYLIGCFCHIVPFYLPTLVTAYLLPLTSGKWWFVACYLVLYLLVPYLNACHNHLDRRQHLNMLLLVGALFSALPTVVFWTHDTVGVGGGYSLLWFMYLYMVAAYVRKYEGGWSVRIPWMGIYLACALLAFVARMVQIHLLKTLYWDWYKYNSLPVLIGSVAVFMAFLNWGKRSSGEARLAGLWRFLGQGTLAVFLIHTHFVPYKEFLWSKWVRADLACTRSLGYFICHLLIWVVGIFIVCECIDWLRRWLFRPIERWLSSARCLTVSSALPK